MNSDEVLKAVKQGFATEAIEIPDSVPDDQMEGWLKGFHEGTEWAYNIIVKILSP